jgi:ring-1,2-phenylacetyl-CoA epoxidase subunit PaaC
VKSGPKEALVEYLIGLGDDELILAHRDSEWAGHAPILEEDIAFANIALDEMGHAAAWYRLAGELQGQSVEAYPDEMVFDRKVDEFRNIQMVELPNGDWAFSLMRQYLFDSLEAVRLSVLAGSDWELLADTAAKIRPEELYHLRHTRAWVRRLGLGTEESNQRMQKALDDLYPYALQPFATSGEENSNVPNNELLQQSWEADIHPTLADANLNVPEVEDSLVQSREEHTSHLSELVEEMQMVARAEAGALW